MRAGKEKEKQYAALKKGFEKYKAEAGAQVQAFREETHRTAQQEDMHGEEARKMKEEIMRLEEEAAELRQKLVLEEKTRIAAEDERDAANKFAKETIEANERLMSEISRKHTHHRHHHHHDSNLTESTYCSGAVRTAAGAYSFAWQNLAH